MPRYEYCGVDAGDGFPRGCLHSPLDICTHVCHVGQARPPLGENVYIVTVMEHHVQRFRVFANSYEEAVAIPYMDFEAEGRAVLIDEDCTLSEVVEVTDSAGRLIPDEE